MSIEREAPATSRVTTSAGEPALRGRHAVRVQVGRDPAQRIATRTLSTDSLNDRTRYNRRSPDVSDGTKVQNRTSITRALKIIGDRLIDELQPRDIADMIALLHGDGVKVGYLRKVVQAVAMTFDHAGVTPNPARDKVIVRMPRAEEQEVNPPTADHVLSVYRLLPDVHRLGLPLLFLDWSGARVSSIDHARVGDYDEQRRRLRLRAATTKTRRALWIELHPVLAEELERRLPPRDDRDLDAQLSNVFARTHGRDRTRVRSTPQRRLNAHVA